MARPSKKTLLQFFVATWQEVCKEGKADALGSGEYRCVKR